MNYFKELKDNLLTFLSSKHKIIFYAKEMPHAFLDLIHSFLEDHHSSLISKSIKDISQKESYQTQHLFEDTSFLHYTIIKTNSSDEQLSHTGPIINVVVTNQSLNKKSTSFQVFQTNILINHKEVQNIMWLFNDQLKWYINELYTIESEFYLNDLCQLTKYALLLQKKNWLPFVNEHKFLYSSSNKDSMYTLMEYWFSKKKSLFFTFFDTLLLKYPIEYVLNFMADSFWQAHIFLIHKKNEKLLANENTKKLPFSFINTDHKLYNEKSLIFILKEIYSLQHRIKIYPIIKNKTITELWNLHELYS
jgi:hypothetical protein